MALLLLPSTMLWVKTPVTLPKEGEVTVKVSGAVNLAVHHLVAAAKIHQRPRLGWIGPGGGPVSTRYDRYRIPVLVKSDAPYGCVLAVFTDLDLNAMDADPRPADIKKIGEQASIRGRGTLWLTVNEAVIGADKESEKAYITDQQALDEKYAEYASTESPLKVTDMEAQYAYIKTRDYRDVFFKDNIGDFLVTIRVERGVKLQ